MAQQVTLARIAGTEGAAAVLVPVAQGDGRRVKLVGQDTLDLLNLLRTPRRLPKNAEPDDDAVIRLVLDDIIEVLADGVFRSGADAHRALGGRVSPAAGEGRLAQLSVLALQHAERLPVLDADRLAVSLYGFNRLPASAKAKQRWPGRDAVLATLRDHTVLQPEYRPHAEGSLSGSSSGASSGSSSGSSSKAWITWIDNGQAWQPSSSGTHKLYVSPAPDQLPEVFTALIPEILRLRPPVLKVGGDAYGILRPDKFVLYFADRSALTTFADAVTPLIAGREPHGVPFTAELAGDGLLSWGLDPPRPPSSPSSGRIGERASWRSWVTARLARAIVEAKRGNGPQPGVRPWQFALARIGLDGVDTRGWQADPSIWHRTGEVATWA